MASLTDQNLFYYCLLSHFLMSPATIISLRFIQAPYGKHYHAGWGPTLSPPLAWFLMESPTIWLTLLILPFGQHRSNPKALTLISVFLLHYIHRTFIYPIRLHKTSLQRSKSANRVPVSIALMAFSYNLLNAYLQARWVSHYANYSELVNWLFWGRFLVGLGIFFCGMRINVQSDMELLALKGKDGGYKIPKGGWFESVSCPNYFGEIVEWFGWTFMTWSLAGLGFFLYTCANLVPRAHANHRWYLEKFGEDYPKSRKAVIPFVY
ncbi:steroid 5-alpha-reductase DET2 [Macadamia integrifolia]|uniref:steroid 5-alpha-reductase DET2 n=1 Tax=Macadamia integrifolia TaxID=60698 RepID=UPI001C4F111F|nr:steroid 5-alpha-reductase DET2 [Macadamia integrifolia]XP_042505373.1 steroid 5-alpha-reductase DET2 [Macadamia integrifolia]XP_042505375.1 steroid 5-alpha-reductase DET2 [Macadamia integrifolia]XP_042505376.1 steroid 5-alpha-reductase DET2 [Macadamia integrifolia]XP_042505377.1 steroid 5-alpha-reductase DET2 [Macadamia integrifolia]